MQRFRQGDKVLVIKDDLPYKKGEVHTLALASACVGIWYLAPSFYHIISENSIVKLPNDFKSLTTIDKILYDIEEKT